MVARHGHRTYAKPGYTMYYPLNRESGVLARTRCHYILTPLFHYPYSSVS